MPLQRKAVYLRITVISLAFYGLPTKTHRKFGASFSRILTIRQNDKTTGLRDSGRAGVGISTTEYLTPFKTGWIFRRYSSFRYWCKAS